MDYAASFLEGDARLWYIASQEVSIRFLDWPPLTTKLGKLYGLLHDKGQARNGLFSVPQCGELDSYVNDFSRLSLQVPELDEHSRAVLFAKGLANKLKSEVLREHPQNLAQAIRAALTAEQLLRLVDSDKTSHSQLHGVHPAPLGQPGSIRFLPASRQISKDPGERESRQERLCFIRHNTGHIARFRDKRRPESSNRHL